MRAWQACTAKPLGCDAPQVSMQGAGHATLPVLKGVSGWEGGAADIDNAADCYGSLNMWRPPLQQHSLALGEGRGCSAAQGQALQSHQLQPAPAPTALGKSPEQRCH